MNKRECSNCWSQATVDLLLLGSVCGCKDSCIKRGVHRGFTMVDRNPDFRETADEEPTAPMAVLILHGPGMRDSCWGTSSGGVHEASMCAAVPHSDAWLFSGWWRTSFK